jgi:putative PIN family toxin of toxin-antitoxin system
MSDESRRVVFDCNIFVQALINVRGPAAECVRCAQRGEIALFVSPFVLIEIREIHEKLPPKYGVTAEETERLATSLLTYATLITDIQELYIHPRDPDDSHYINLALATNAELIVTRDRDLLSLMDDSADSQAFRA